MQHLCLTSPPSHILNPRSYYYLIFLCLLFKVLLNYLLLHHSPNYSNWFLGVVFVVVCIVCVVLNSCCYVHVLLFILLYICVLTLLLRKVASFPHRLPRLFSCVCVWGIEWRGLLINWIIICRACSINLQCDSFGQNWLCTWGVVATCSL